MIDTTFLRQLDKFNLIIRKRITSNYSGSRASTSFGQGLTFKDYKDYVKGDDFRKIDWKLYARTDKFYIKHYEEERNLTVHIIIDRSASMDFGAGTTKFDYASMIGVGFAYMAMKNNERFRLATFAEELTLFKTGRGSHHLLSILDYLNKLKVEGKSKLEDNLVPYGSAIRSKSLLILLSDFLFDVNELKDCLAALRKNELIVVQVLDPTEIDFQLEGDVMLYDSETKNVLRTYFSRRMKEMYKYRFKEHVFQIQDMCDKLGITFMPVTTDTPIFDTFYKILQ